MYTSKKYSNIDIYFLHFIKPRLALLIIPLISYFLCHLAYSQDDQNISYLDTFTGQSILRYRVQKLEGDKSDVDLYEYLSLSQGDLNKNRVKWYFFGALHNDLDGSNANSITKDQLNRLIFRKTPAEDNPVVSNNPFFSIDDSVDDGFTARPYELYADVAKVPLVKNVRIGRQYMREIENIHFDGLKVEFNDIKGLRFGLFGGMPVHFFETSNSGDFLSGTFVEFKPIKGSRVKLDYSYVNDNNDDFSGNGDNFFALSVRQNIKGWWNIFAGFSMLDDNGRDVELRSTWLFPKHNFDINISIFKQLNTQEDLTIEFDDFNVITGDYFPYTEYSLNLFKGINKNINVNFGLNIRELNDESDEGSFNHEFSMYYATLTFHDLPFKGTSINLTGNLYNTSDDDTRALGIDINQEINKKTNVSIGTHYSLFKYDFLSENERDNVRTYFLNTKYNITKKLQINLDYEFERSDQESYHTVETALKYKF